MKLSISSVKILSARLMIEVINWYTLIKSWIHLMSTLISEEGNGQCTKKDPCLNNPCQNGGTCTQTEQDFTCVCSPGWQGRLCIEEGDPCSPNPCQNGGECSGSTGSDFTCTCQPGFSGPECQVDIDECDTDPSPCVHGTCMDKVTLLHLHHLDFRHSGIPTVYCFLRNLIPLIF